MAEEQKRQKINEYMRPRKRARDQKYSTTVLQSFSIFAQRDSNLKKKKHSRNNSLKNYVNKSLQNRKLLLRSKEIRSDLAGIFEFLSKI